MILVDSSVWVDHFRAGNDRLATHLKNGEVMVHPFVIGELACGNLRRRDDILELLAALPATVYVSHSEVLELVRERRLFGSGIGWIDAHLLASALITGTSLWTLDRPLRGVAGKLGVAAS